MGGIQPRESEVYDPMTQNRNTCVEYCSKGSTQVKGDAGEVIPDMAVGRLFQRAALWSPQRNLTLDTLSFTPIEDKSYGPIRRTVFSSTCPTESLRILGLCFGEKVTQSSTYPVGNIFFTHGRKSVQSFAHNRPYAGAGPQGDMTKRSKWLATGVGDECIRQVFAWGRSVDSRVAQVREKSPHSECHGRHYRGCVG